MNDCSLPHAGAFTYLESTIPAGMTIAEWRRSLPAKPTRAQRLASGIRGLRAAPQPTAATATFVSSGPTYAGVELARPERW